MSHFKSWEMVVPRNLNDSTAVTVLFKMVSGGRAGGFLLKSTIISTVLSVLSSRLLRLHQAVPPVCKQYLLNLLSVSRLVTILDESDQCGVVCKLQEIDRGVFRCAVIGVQQRFSIPVSNAYAPPPPRSAHFVCFSYRFRRLFYSNVKCPAKWTSQDIPPLFQFEANVYVPCKVH